MDTVCGTHGNGMDTTGRKQHGYIEDEQRDNNEIERCTGAGRLLTKERTLLEQNRGAWERHETTVGVIIQFPGLEMESQ